MPLNKRHSDLKQLAQKATLTLDPQAKLNNLTISVSGPSAYAEIDPDIILRVIINLITNAIKASPEGAAIKIVSHLDESGAGVSVHDSGKGIPEKLVDQVFEKFSTGENEKWRKASAGLGLTFCKLAVEAHNGIIEVKSEEGKGSTFRFSIPANIPSQKKETDS
jgi:signal transduction histidine kinase